MRKKSWTKNWTTLLKLPKKNDFCPAGTAARCTV